MSVDDKPSQIMAPSRGTVMVSSSRRRWTHKPLWIAIILLLLIVVIGGVYVHLNSQPRRAKPVAAYVFPENSVQKASSLASDGDYTAAQKILAAQVKSASTSQAKSLLCVQQAFIALQAHSNVAASNYAQQALQLAPTSPGAYNALASVAQANGNTASAKADWQKAISLLDMSNPRYNSVVQEYQQDIARLGA